jgi:hypothetical protein
MLRPETLKLVQERVRNTLKHIGKGSNILLNSTPMAQQLREELTSIGLHGYEKLLHSKRNGHQIEEVAHRRVENLCQLYI